MSSDAALTRVRSAIDELSRALAALQSARAELERSEGSGSDVHDPHANQRQPVPIRPEVGVAKAAATLGVSCTTVDVNR